jgi:hypothetical protein
MDPNEIDPTVLKGLESEVRDALTEKDENGLQFAYADSSTGEELFFPRHEMTLEQRQRAIAALEREATAKMAHADALDAETDKLIQTGKLVAEVPPTFDQAVEEAMRNCESDDEAVAWFMKTYPDIFKEHERRLALAGLEARIASMLPEEAA